jgi:hypothetical protein
MSWRAGTEVCIEAWDEIREFVKPEDRPYCLKVLIEALQNADWNNVDEVKRKWPDAKKALEMMGECDEEPV